MAERTDTFTTLPAEADEGIASSEEVRAAIESLTDGELLRLERYARFRMRGLGARALGRTHEDLLKEAMAATLAGDRRWKRRKVDLFTHLIGVMRSYSSHWSERERPVRYVAESELGPAPDVGPTPDRVLEARQQIRRIEGFFADDAVVLRLIDGMRDGLTGPEIQVTAGLSKRDYESALKRMRRGLARMEEKEDGRHGP